MIKKNSFKLAFIYLGTILGAGFASGKELVNFFARFKEMGIIGFLITCFLLSISFMAILDLIKNSHAKDYKQFLNEVFGEKIAKILEVLNTTFLFIIFSAMLAGGGAVLSSIFGINFKLCTVIFSFIIFISLFFGQKSVILINSILCPILIFGGALIGIYIYFFETIQTININDNAITQSIVYTSFNIITTISVLFGVRNLILNNKVVVFSGILGGLFIFFIGIFLILSLVYNYDLIKYEDLPILYIIKDVNIIKLIYTSVILMAIYTTALGNGFALENIIYEKINKKRIFIKILILLLGIFVSFIGFSNMVEKIYPIFGYLGLFQLITIFILFYLKKMKN